MSLLRGLALAKLEDFGRAARELAEVIPHLEGQAKVEGMIGRVRSTLWTEQTDQTMSGAELALQLARAGGFSELEAVALGLLGSAHGMRGDAGDLDTALRLTDQALQSWKPDTRQVELAELYHLCANHLYWAGDYERATQATTLAATTAGVKLLREIFAVDEALTRSEEVTERLGPSDFNMPWMNARADVFAARVLRGDLSDARHEWGALWDDAIASKAWEQRLVSGRLAAIRADLDLSMGRAEDALTWGGRAIEMAVASRRKKYEAIARTTVGRALTTQYLYEEALVELRRAVATSDDLGSPLVRWQSRAALAQALAGAGADAGTVFAEAAEIIQAVTARLSPEHAAGYLAAQPVVEVLDSVS